MCVCVAGMFVCVCLYVHAYVCLRVLACKMPVKKRPLDMMKLECRFGTPVSSRITRETALAFCLEARCYTKMAQRSCIEVQ